MAPSVLFVCVHNAGRSQMAAALLDNEAQGRVQVTSAGSQPAAELNPAVVAAMAEIGLDLSREFPKPLTGEQVQPPTSSSRWVAGTPAPSTRGSATSTGT
jgi:arsenate reductase (thioredoxin)